MRFMMTASALVAVLISQTAQAATERLRCGASGKSPTTVEIDREAKTFLVSEAGSANFQRVAFCASIDKMVGDLAASATPRCSVAFGEASILADYVSTAGQVNFVIAIALNTQAMTLTSYARIDDSTLTETVPCRLL